MAYYFECANCDNRVEVFLEDEPDLETSCMGCGVRGCDECVIQDICDGCDVNGVDNDEDEDV